MRSIHVNTGSVSGDAAEHHVGALAIVGTHPISYQWRNRKTFKTATIRRVPLERNVRPRNTHKQPA